LASTATVNAAPTSQVVHIPVTIVRGSNLARFPVQWTTFNPATGVSPKSGTLRVPRGATTASINITIPAYTTGGLDQEFVVNFVRSTRTVVVSGQTVVTVSDSVTGAIVATWTQPARYTYAHLGGLTTYPDPEQVSVAVNAANWTFPPAATIAQPAFCLF
jgi:hypothetical protein